MNWIIMGVITGFYVLMTLDSIRKGDPLMLIGGSIISAAMTWATYIAYQRD